MVSNKIWKLVGMAYHGSEIIFCEIIMVQPLH